MAQDAQPTQPAVSSPGCLQADNARDQGEGAALFDLRFFPSSKYRPGRPWLSPRPYQRYAMLWNGFT